MRKCVLPIIMSAIIILSAGAGVFGSGSAIVPDMNFVGEPVKLSLTQAVEAMQTTSSRADTAALNKAADEAVAKGYKESAQSISDFIEKMKGGGIAGTAMAEAQGATELNEKITKIRRDFANGQLEANYKAELNEIEAATIKIYYGILLAEENLKVAKDNLANQKAIYQNVMKKYKLGTVAKIDTLAAETSVATAEDQMKSSETAVKNAKMSLNLLLGYDLMQEVTVTDKLQMVKEPEGSLTGFIESAIKSRNEIRGAALAVQIQDMMLTNLKYRYPTNSSTYLKQEAATLQAKKALEDAPLQIEMDIRSRYMDVADKKRAVIVAEANLKNAKEGYRIATISYNAGVNTLTDVQTAQINSFRAAQGVAAAVNDYDLAVYEFKHAIDVGTSRLPL
ncbi:hypothetical protein MASR2M70_20550 [Bacillota bacterium]